MNYYKKVNNFFEGPGYPKPDGMETGTVNSFNSINIPYAGYLLPSNSLNRQGAPGPGTFGPNEHNLGQIVQPRSKVIPENNQAVKSMDDYFLNGEHFPQAANNMYEKFGDISLQSVRPPTTTYSVAQVGGNLNNLVSNNKVKDYYVKAASQSLHVSPDPLMSIYFSDDNINHLRNEVVKRVRQITADSGVSGDNQGVSIQTPNMDDFFYYMVNIFQNHKIHNGSICFVNIKNGSSLKEDISKLNTNVLQEYVSKMVSQINMYIYYYKDASQLPEQLSLPVYTSMRSNNKVLEYNTGFSSGNSLGMASYDQVGNII
jgi:hypothetical protein